MLAPRQHHVQGVVLQPAPVVRKVEANDEVVVPVPLQSPSAVPLNACTKDGREGQCVVLVELRLRADH